MKKLFLMLPLILLLLNYRVIAQEDVLRPNSEGKDKIKFKEAGFYFGFEAGINFCFFNQKVSPNAASIFETIKTGNGTAPFFGIIADFPINKNFGIQTRLNYDAKHVSNSGSGVDYTTLGDISLYHQMDLTVEQDLKFISLSILARINATNELFFTIGPTFQFRIGDIETTWKPVSKDGTGLQYFPFWGDGLGLTGTAGTEKVTELGAISSRIGLEFGVGYKIPIGLNIILIPKAQFQFMLTNTAENTRWVNYLALNEKVTASDKMLHSFQIGVAVLFGI